jgi:hypothetical protein
MNKEDSEKLRAIEAVVKRIQIRTDALLSCTAAAHGIIIGLLVILIFK